MSTWIRLAVVLQLIILTGLVPSARPASAHQSPIDACEAVERVFDDRSSTYPLACIETTEADNAFTTSGGGGDWHLRLERLTLDAGESIAPEKVAINSRDLVYVEYGTLTIYHTAGQYERQYAQGEGVYVTHEQIVDSAFFGISMVAYRNDGPEPVSFIRVRRTPPGPAVDGGFAAFPATGNAERVTLATVTVRADFFPVGDTFQFLATLAMDEDERMEELVHSGPMLQVVETGALTFEIDEIDAYALKTYDEAYAAEYFDRTSMVAAEPGEDITIAEGEYVFLPAYTTYSLVNHDNDDLSILVFGIVSVNDVR